MSDIIEQPAPADKYMIDSYDDWAKAEGVPLVAAAAVDLLTQPVAPWPRYGMDGAICHLSGRGDFLTLFLFEMAPACQSALLHHLYEEVYVALSGRGTTVIDQGNGKSERIAWKAGSLFAVPLNARHHHVNEGHETARLASVNDLRYLFNVFRNEAFVFANPASFSERTSSVEQRGGTHWETAQAIDLAALKSGKQNDIEVTLVQGVIGASLHDVAPGSNREGPHREAACFLFGIDGAVNLRHDPNGLAIDLRPGLVTASPPDAAYQLSNSQGQAARVLAVRMGSARYPLLRTKRNA